MYDYLIVGSGLSGAVFAHEAMKHQKSCIVLEKRSHAGGNVYCENIHDINVHKYGAHIFHTDNTDIWNYVCGFAEFNNYVNSPMANYHGEIYNMPFNMNTFSKLWGISTPKQAADIIENQRSELNKEPENLEVQAIRLVGRDIFEKLVRGYTEKQWGRPCKELPPFIIKRLPVRFTYDNNYFNDRYQGIPIGGYNVIIEKLLHGADLRLETDYLSDRTKYNSMAKKVVYTGMLDEYFDYRFGKLEYRSLRFENEILNEANHQGVAVMNYTDAETPFTRVIEHKHFEFGSQPETVITKEYPAEWQSGMEPYYPVNDAKNQSLYSQYRKLADEETNVIFAGRLADYRYYDMDDAIAAVLSITRREFNDKQK